MKTLSILGSTGSIGRSTLSVVDSFPERYQVVALAAGRNLTLVREQARRYRPQIVTVASRDHARQLAAELAAELPETRVLSGQEGLIEVACHPQAEMVMAALVGSIGLVPVLRAIRSGKDIALANKETLVVAGDLVMAEVAAAGVNLIPVDSEHNALHQALRVGPAGTVQRLVLTASGGPFRTWSAEQIANATVDQALAHPTWQMGPKITIDSATLINKGLEIIEAHHLFAMPEEQIGVVVHPQSLVHSLVEYCDGTLIAQLSVNDMRFPIMYALGWPDRLPTPLPALDLVQAGQLSFEQPDVSRFPALELARQSLRAGGEMPAVLNAANEVAVQAFLERQIPFPGITACIAAVMEEWQSRNHPLESLEQVLAADTEVRARAGERIAKGLDSAHYSE